MLVLKDLKAFEVQQQSLSRVLIALEGTWEGHITGPFTITRDIMLQMKQNHDNKLIDTVCDFEHQTLTGNTAPASGWVKEMQLEDIDGKAYLYAMIDWTDEARVMIEKKQYRYVSPVYIANTTDQKSGKNVGWSVHSVSLTNVPFLEELGEVYANRSALEQELKALKEKNEELTASLSKAEETIAEMSLKERERMVTDAIAMKRIRPEQKEDALKLANDNPEAFYAFMSKGVPSVQLPPNDIFANRKGERVFDDDSHLNKVAAGIK
jgi:phage I-like protein